MIETARNCLLGIFLSSVVLYASVAVAEDCGRLPKAPARIPDVAMTVTQTLPAPVLTVRSPGAEGIIGGFEGGTVVKTSGRYQAFITEMMQGFHTRLAQWSSVDGLSWQRIQTVFSSSGNYNGEDPRAALWAPMPVYNDAEGRWNLFYVAYRSKPDTPEAWYGNYAGEIVRAVSQVKGTQAIDGPYRDAGVILHPGADSDPWEGLQGDDSFFPYQAAGRWFAFYGTAHTEKKPAAPGHPGQTYPRGPWQVGLASAESLAGPWKRCSILNPVPLEKEFLENPVVSKVNGVYLAIYDVDGEQHQSIGYAASLDGVHWGAGKKLLLFPGNNGSARTPLALVPEKDGTFSLFVTGHPAVAPSNKDKEASAAALFRFQVRVTVQ